MQTKPATEDQIRILIAQSCTATDWSRVFLAPGCNVSRIRTVHFGGEVHIGTNAGSVDYHGLLLPCGVYDASVSDCTIGNDVRIASVRVGLSRYRIEDGALIQDVGLLAAQPGSRFGNGVPVDVVNEAGGRTIVIFNRLTAQVAYLATIYRHDPAFIKNLNALISAEVEATTPPNGVVGAGSRIVGCGFIRDVVVGPYAHLEGCTRLENGTVNSCREHPTTIGAGVNARSFVVAEGATIDGGAIIDKVFVGQAVRMGKQYSAENSLFFANCEVFHGEAASVFAGPYTVSHHKSTLLIAGLFSFYNAGSGTNQSNHMYKLGPVHQGIFERGCKTGSSSYVLLESHLGAFSVLLGKHLANIRIPNLPFSYLSEKGGESSIVPGMNLFSVGTQRDAGKWLKRDGRKAAQKRDLIRFEVFSPYTVEKMRRGRDELLALNETTPKERASVFVGGVQMARPLLRKGARYYQMAVTRYLYGKVLDHLADQLAGGHPWDEALSALKPEVSLAGPRDWTDVCGLLTPVELVMALERDVAEGRCGSYDALLELLHSLFQGYDSCEWHYVVETFEREAGFPLSALTSARALQLVDEWQKAALSLHASILEDSRREFGAFARIGYGLDLPDAVGEADFAAVRGTMESNAVIQTLIAEGEALALRANALRTLLERAGSAAG
jgi:hypothetical protein